MSDEGSWLTLEQVIALFKECGCTCLVEEQEDDAPPIRVLYNPENDEMVSITIYAAYDKIHPDTLEGWRRQLNAEFPGGSTTSH